MDYALPGGSNRAGRGRSGAVPKKMEDGDKLGALVENPPSRAERTRCNVTAGEPLGPLLQALWAGFVLDCDVFVIDNARAMHGREPFDDPDRRLYRRMVWRTMN